MSTSARILANRENAQLSTGPRTAAGKTAVADQRPAPRTHRLQHLHPRRESGRVRSLPCRTHRLLRAGQCPRTGTRQPFRDRYFDERLKHLTKEHDIDNLATASVFVFTDHEQMKRLNLYLRYRKSIENACRTCRRELGRA